MAPLQLLPVVSTELQRLLVLHNLPSLSRHNNRVSIGTATSALSYWCLSFKEKIVMFSLLCVTITLSHTSFTWSFSIAGKGLCSYHFSPHSRSYFSLNSPLILNAVLSWRFLYSFCAKLAQPLTMCHIVSEIFPHNLHEGESLVLSV